MRHWELLITQWSAGTLGVAVIALLVGFRGRRVDDHPICRKCGFDLFGLPATRAKCPECGRDLAGRRRRRIGNRRRNRSFLVTGLLLFTASAGWLIFFGVTTARKVDWNQYKPVSWLIRDTRSLASQRACFDEITRRLDAGKLTDAEFLQLAEAALAHQANRSEAWLSQWGAFLERAHQLNRLSEAQWTRYLEQGCNHYEIEVRKTVRRGQPVPLRIRALAERLWKPSNYRMALSASIEFEGQHLLPTQWSGDLTHWSGSTAETVVPLPAHGKPVALGPHRLTATLDVTMSAPAKRLVRKQLRIKREFTITDEIEIGIRPIYDPTMERAVHDAFSVTAGTAGGNLHIDFQVAPPPADLSFMIALVFNNVRYDLGETVLRAKERNKFDVTIFPDGRPAKPGDQVDIVFVPNPLLAEETVDLKSIWGGVVELQNVPVVLETSPQRWSPGR